MSHKMSEHTIQKRAAESSLSVLFKLLPQPVAGTHMELAANICNNLLNKL